MPKPLVIILGVVTLGSWLILGGRKSAWEKMMIIVVIVSMYVAIRWMRGDTFREMFSYFLR